MSMRGLFVTGTDTGVGKTVVAAAIAATLAARGERVSVLKPVVTGLDDLESPLPDHELLLASARSVQTPEDVALYRFGPPVSPHLAAELAGTRVRPTALVGSARRASRGADVLIVEGVGGLMVPLTRDYLVADFARALELPVIVVARPGLGTINHCLLTLEAARARDLPVAAVVLSPWPEEPTEVERSNLETIAALGDVQVATLGPLYSGPPINAVGDLPLDSWIRKPAAASMAAVGAPT
jgi:dethiobiotin synthetase